MYITMSCNMNEIRIAKYRYMFFLFELDLELYALNNWYITNSVKAAVIASFFVDPLFNL